MTQRVVPDVRAGLPVLLRAVGAGAVLGGLVGTILLLADDTSTIDDRSASWIVLQYGCGIGAAVALLSAVGWLAVVGHGPRWAAEAVAGLVAALPFVAFAWLVQAWWAVTAVPVVGVLAALLARWQGYERDRPRWLRPRSSPRVG